MSTNVHLVNGGKNELMSIRGLDELFFPGSAEKYSRIVEAVSRLVTTPEALGNVERSALLMIKMGKIPANMAADMLLYQATWERRLVRPFRHDDRLRAQCDREDVTGLFYQAMYVYFKGGLNRDHPTLLAGMYICAAAFAGAPGVEFAFLGLVSFRVRFKEEEYGVLFNTYRAVAPDLRETYESAFASAQSVMARHIPGVTLYDEVCDCVNPSSSAGEGVRGFQAWGRSVQNAAEARECEAQMRKGMAGGLAAGALMFGLVIMRIPRERMTPPWTRLAQAWTQVEESDAQTQRS
eukprot:jgi/Mesvir1/25148/Mv18828-RA.1